MYRTKISMINGKVATIQIYEVKCYCCGDMVASFMNAGKAVCTSCFKEIKRLEYLCSIA